MPPTDDDVTMTELSTEMRRAVRVGVTCVGDTVTLDYAGPDGTPVTLRVGRHALADAMVPIDDGEPADAAWLASVGGDDERGDGDRVWLIGSAAWLCVGLGGGVWHCWVRSGHGDSEETVTLPRLATRGQLRRLLAALGVVPAGV